MHVRLLTGPAGSGKTFRCLSEARAALAASAEGLPLILVAPKQGTYQLERQLLATPLLAGYTRLSIVSFETLAHLIFKRLGAPSPQILAEEGRVMVLRALLTETRQHLNLFRASARLNGFAQQLSHILAQLQSAGLSPAALRQLAAEVVDSRDLSCKLQDLSTLLERYQQWLASHNLLDGDGLLRSAAELLRARGPSDLRFARLWVDGFAEFSAVEMELLCSLIQRCEQATVTFCLDTTAQYRSWVSHWSVTRSAVETLGKRISELPNVVLVTETLTGMGRENRFSTSPILRHLERHWIETEVYVPNPDEPAAGPIDSLRLIQCPDRQAEATLAAREILKFVRAGGRYREASVLVRNLGLYHQVVQRAFSRYEIPFFLDRREAVAHHPLAELTRGGLRAAALAWQHADWFAALKSGLVPAEQEDIDLLENEALARGWTGRSWHQPLQLTEQPKTPQDRERLDQLAARLEKTRRAIVPAFEKLSLRLMESRNRPTGIELAAAIRELWSELRVQEQLENWAVTEPAAAGGASVHETVWRQMDAWLDNAELAFPGERLSLREWLSILEAGLASLTVGLIPPSLDQVLVCAVDRSRTPEVKLALVLGLNEGVFPAAPESGTLLTQTDRLELEKLNVNVGQTARRQIARERYLAYIGCTRARHKLILTWASRDPAGAPLNPSPLISQVKQLFPNIETETAPTSWSWSQSEHVSELVAPLLKMCNSEQGTNGPKLPETAEPAPDHSALRTPHSALERLATLFETLGQFRPSAVNEVLSPDVAARLYGPALRSSVSRMEHFAACPFKFFVHSGLRAEERKLFTLDPKERGTFQHEVLALFHEQLRGENKRWRDLAPGEARELVGRIAQAYGLSFRAGLLQTNGEGKFTARVLAESLKDFVETLVDWMRQQYRFDPVQVELAFGEEGSPPAWSLGLGDGRRVELRGRIDRVDLYCRPGTEAALCVVIDYKSSHKELDPILIEHGLQLQLLTYLNVLRSWPDPKAAFGVCRLEPAGVFYVNLRGRFGRERNRRDALADPALTRKLAYRHTGRFDHDALGFLDGRGAAEGDQFNYRLTQAGEVHKGCKEAMGTAEFEALLDQIEQALINMARQIYSGRIELAPYRKGSLTACDQCSYQGICRIDPWTHPFRLLRRHASKPGPAALSS